MQKNMFTPEAAENLTDPGGQRVVVMGRARGKIEY